ncbi:hypothetical protein RJ639_011573 [Escallonia herrerae]|uniref:Rhodanese domain-containing protein n=1 Tax=Escallonia herrerae TaxID=1293975 RepID=A0AA89ARF8_9ASTE|nr:hypothetical protein RJ639_011573 [Escallonia herrerae]
MESLSIGLSSSLPHPNHPKTHKPTFKPNFLLSKRNNSTFHPSISHQTHCPFPKKTSPIPQSNITPTTHFPNLSKHNPPFLEKPQLFQIFLSSPLSFLGLTFSFPLSCIASESFVPTDQVSNRINLEAILVSIDAFFNRYPFFVAGVTFIWLVVIPLTEDYLAKVKFISAINAFRKLRDDPNSQLLDIRDGKSLGFLGSPNLKILNKGVVQVEFLEGDDEGFVKKVLEKLRDPANTSICIIDNFDGNSMKVAELLFKNGFKEAYAILGGVRGKSGWLAIQETLLPPSVHISPKKKVKKLEQQREMNGVVNLPSENDGQPIAFRGSELTENGYVNNSSDPNPQTKLGLRPLSPFAKVKPY